MARSQDIFRLVIPQLQILGVGYRPRCEVCGRFALVLERDTRSIKTVWKAVCEDAGVNGASPKTLRHTMLTWLAMRGVPKEQRSALAGHVARDTTARNYEHLSPDYLRSAIDQIDTFFEELAKHTSAHLRYANDTEIESAEAA